MTVIAAHRDGWMVADTLTTFKGYWKGPFKVTKILDFGHTLVACAGDSCLKQKLPALMSKHKTAKTFKKHFVEYMRESSSENDALVVNTGRELYAIINGTLLELQDSENFYSIGSGSDLVQGYLGAIHASAGKVKSSDCVEAIKYAGRYTVSINDKIDVMTLKKAKKK